MAANGSRMIPWRTSAVSPGRGDRTVPASEARLSSALVRRRRGSRSEGIGVIDPPAIRRGRRRQRRETEAAEGGTDICTPPTLDGGERLADDPVADERRLTGKGRQNGACIRGETLERAREAPSRL